MQASRAAATHHDEITGEHHCPEHLRFNAGCASCCRARAAFLPYPVKTTAASAPASRAFGYKDQMTPEMIKTLTGPPQDWRLSVMKFVVNLFVPFVWR